MDVSHLSATDMPEPVADADWPESAMDLFGGFASQLNVYRVMAHHPRLLRAWAPLRNHVVVDNALGRQRSEVIILRAAVRLGSDYEWQHHVSRARACGLEDARIAALRGKPQDMQLEDGVLARAVDELFNDAQIDPVTLAALATLVGKEGVIDVMATVGFYSTLGYMLKTFGTPIDDAVASEMAARPLALK
jgi:4-carboxymuconolactone decarboxylase